MKLNNKGLTIVAEMACAHDGDMDYLLDMIKAASVAKVDVVQFQFFRGKEITAKNSDLYRLAHRLQIPFKFYKRIFSLSKKESLRIWATVGDIISAKHVYDFKPEMWRVHSADINNKPLIDFLCKTNIPISFSIGGSSLEEIDYAVKIVFQCGKKVKALIHGFQGYPTPIKEVNLAFISFLKEKYKCIIGYQDHTDGEDPLGFILPTMAMAFGAKIIEKHLTLDRKRKGTDYHSSLDPGEMKQFVIQVRKAQRAIGLSYRKSLGKHERQYHDTFKKGLTFSRSLFAGKKLSPADIRIVRCKGLEIYGNKFEEIIGKRLKHYVKKDQIIRWSNLEEK